MSNLLKITGDNSPTLFSEKFQVNYHSVHGALKETQVVFIEAGLNYFSAEKKQLNILEIGLGTGLNCLATIHAINNDCNINYIAVEKYPLTTEEVNLFQQELKKIPELVSTHFDLIHSSSWNTRNRINDNFALTKLNIDFSEINLPDKVDLIYFDAFAPETQPELWTIEMFQLMVDHLVQGGILTTYCAKGYVKRNLKAAGFGIETLPGPPGKREITRAIKL